MGASRSTHVVLRPRGVLCDLWRSDLTRFSKKHYDPTVASRTFTTRPAGRPGEIAGHSTCLPARTPMGVRGLDGARVGGSAPMSASNWSPGAALLSAPGQCGPGAGYASGDRGDRRLCTRPSTASRRQPPGRLPGAEASVLPDSSPRCCSCKPPPPPERCAKRTEAQPAPRRRGHLPPLRRVQPLPPEWVLGPTMAYTCAVFPRADTHAGAGAGSIWCVESSVSSRAWVLDTGCGWVDSVARREALRGRHRRGHLVGQAGPLGQRAVRKAGLEADRSAATATTVL